MEDHLACKALPHVASALHITVECCGYLRVPPQTKRFVDLEDVSSRQQHTTKQITKTKGLMFMTRQHLVFIPPFGTLVPLLLAAAGFHCSVTCLVRSPALQQPRQLNLRRVADVDREFRVGSPSTREEMTYYAVSSCPISLGPQLELQEFATLPTYCIINRFIFLFVFIMFKEKSWMGQSKS